MKKNILILLFIYACVECIYIEYRLLGFWMGMLKLCIQWEFLPPQLVSVAIVFYYLALIANPLLLTVTGYAVWRTCINHKYRLRYLCIYYLPIIIPEAFIHYEFFSSPLYLL